MNYHPDSKILQSYVEGTLEEITALTIAMHLEVCPQCQRQAQLLEQRCGEVLLETAVAGVDENFDAMFDEIVNLDQSSEPLRRQQPPKSIEVNGKTFMLPRAISRLSDKIGEWRSYGGKVFSAPVDISHSCRVNLMYIAQGVQIPQHTHKGIESTLILHGGFSDEDGHYEVGDYLVKDAAVKHSPFTKNGEDCLCLTVLTEPMIFTQGVARLFNRFGKGMYP